MPFSYHSHSGQFCGHAQDSLEEIVKAAIAKNMRVFALTEHMPREDKDMYPEEVSFLPYATCSLEVDETFADSSEHHSSHS